MPGTVAPGYEPVRAAFEEGFERRGEVGAAFAAVVDGELVVDLWGGQADAEEGRAWERDSLQLIFSGTKGLVAGCVLLLVDDGLVSLAEPLATYWPEFAAEGKHDVTVLEVLTHRAGVPVVVEPLTWERVGDAEGIARLLARQVPFWPGGRRMAYHALTYGWLCGELVRRVTGETIGAFFARRVARPLGLDAHIGLRAREQPRVTRLAAHETFAVESPLREWGYARLRYANPDLFSDPAVWNDPAIHRAEIAGANGIATARAMAVFYGCLAAGGALGGVRVWSEQAAELARTRIVRDADAFTGEPLAYGPGFEHQTAAGQFGPDPGGFGHSGAGGGIHGAWPRRRAGFSYATNQLRGDGRDPRGRALLGALDEALGGLDRSKNQ